MKHSAFERFLQGDDGLASVLREALPAFEAPVAMELRFRDQVKALQGQREGAESLAFEAPASQGIAFARLAADVQAAQSIRRDAVIGQIRSGRPAEQVLGTGLSPDGLAWLQLQSQAATAQVPAVRRNLAKSTVWWGAGAAFASLVLVLVGVQTGGILFGPAAEPRDYSGAVASASVAELAQLDTSVFPAEPGAQPPSAKESASRDSVAPESAPSGTVAAQGAGVEEKKDTDTDENARLDGPMDGSADGSEFKSNRETDALASKSVARTPASSEALTLNEELLPAPSARAASSVDASSSAPVVRVPSSAHAAARNSVPTATPASDKQAGERLVLVRNSPVAAAQQLLADEPQLSSVTVLMVSGDDAVHRTWLSRFTAALQQDKPGAGVLLKVIPTLEPDRVLLQPHVDGQQ